MRILVLMSGLALLPGAQCSGQGRPFDSKFIDAADAVVVGELQSGRQNGSSAFFVLAVDRTIRGAVSPGTTLNVRWDNVSPQATRDIPKMYCLSFLQADGRGSWKLTSVTQGRYPQPCFPISKGGQLAAVQTQTPHDVVASALAAGVEQAGNTTDRYRNGNALLKLQRTNTVLSAFRSLSVNPEPTVRCFGLAGLIRASDPGALDEVSKNSTLITPWGICNCVHGSIASIRDTSPTVVRALGRIAALASTDAQRAAIDPLRDMHTRDAVPFLVALLDASEAPTRERAISGLSMFVENLPAITPENTPSQEWRIPQPGPTPYKSAETDRYSLSHTKIVPTRETEYIQFWKSWWVRVKNDFPPASK